MSEKADGTRDTGQPIPHKVDFDPSNPTKPPVERRVLARQLTQATLDIENLRRELQTDKLTGLANRTVLDEELPKLFNIARTSGEPLAALTIDVDKLKKVNDELGHPKGDLFIRAAGAAIRSAVRPEDIVGRQGGDEFFVIMPSYKPLAGQDREALDNELRERIEANFKEQTRQLGLPDEYNVGMSVGIATMEDLEEDAGPEVLIEKADQDSYAQKRARGSARQAQDVITYDDRLGAA